MPTAWDISIWTKLFFAIVKLLGTGIVIALLPPDLFIPTDPWLITSPLILIFELLILEGSTVSAGKLTEIVSPLFPFNTEESVSPVLKIIS